MSGIKYFGIVAVKHSSTERHPNYISHVYAIKVTDGGYSFPGKLYTRADAIRLVDEYSVKTLMWDYSTANWKIGFDVTTETVNGTRYLRSKPDSTKIDNLSNLIDYDYFGTA